MKKTLFCLFLIVSIVLCAFSSYWLFDMVKGYADAVKLDARWKQTTILYSVFLASALYGVAISVYLIIKELANPARLTYEEYKERAKQKKLEKTRKKMQKLEEKLQKESTE